MARLFLQIYDNLSKFRIARYSLLACLTIVILFLVSTLGYKEDISDFIPFGGKHATALKMYQNISGAKKIFVTFRQDNSTKADPDRLVSAADYYVSTLEQDYALVDSLHIVAEVDMETMDTMLRFVYSNIPFLLTDADYSRIDSLLSVPEYVSRQLEEDKRMLQFPVGGILTDNIGCDPLNLFTPVVERLSAMSSGVKYENYDSHIFTPDMQTAIVMLDTPYGASESEGNRQLLAVLDSVSVKTMAEFADVEIGCIGSPVIAVGNARQIKQDSVVNIGIAVTLILLLLLYVFRSAKNIMLIAVSIAWGWLFALAALSLLHDKVSVIVVGISSVILGIAVNYPLHMIAHMTHVSDKRSAFREIITPLLVGNVTTVGAFLALVPLQSVALRDLGLFASFLLLGTILFTLIFLPHFVSKGIKSRNTFIDILCNVRLETKSWLVAVIAILTAVFGYFSLNTKFDSNMAHLNYMTEQDRKALYGFQQMLNTDSTVTQMYTLVSAQSLQDAMKRNEKVAAVLKNVQANGALTSFNSCSNILVSDSVRHERVVRWKKIVNKYQSGVHALLQKESDAMGFASDSFEGFNSIMSMSVDNHASVAFQDMADMLYGGYVMHDESTGTYNIVTQISTTKTQLPVVERTMASLDDVFCFDMNSINNAISSNMSDNFNYIGWACGLIVFLFLWLSMGRIELAIISFTPMAVSWVWILGLMSLLDIQFNIVNIILATFIFGQGDDYTIFMTEGASYEYTYGKKILHSYKHSIIVSAIIMFVGIGTLIVAKHPALHSLAEVTIIGMFAVVLMAYMLPPLLFKWLVSSHNLRRQRPLTLKRQIIFVFAAIVFFCQLGVAYMYGGTLKLLLQNKKQRRKKLQSFVYHLCRFDMTHLPGVKFVVDADNIDLDKPSLIISNHQSMLDSAIFMALSPKLILVSNTKVSSNIVISTMFEWLGYISLSSHIEENTRRMSEAVKQGYSIVMFPEGKRNPDSSILRFHKGAFMIADSLGIDLSPVMIHGVNDVLPRNSITLFGGTITLQSLGRISHSDKEFGDTYSERTRSVHRLYVSRYEILKKQLETLDYFKAYILDRYLYKGNDIISTVKKNLNRGFDNKLIYQKEDSIYVTDHGYGELALVSALINPKWQIVAIMDDTEKAEVLRYSAQGIVSNLDIRTR